MADFVGFVKGRCTLEAAYGAGQAQCSMKRDENVMTTLSAGRAGLS
jgi:hypothetical protein